MIKSINNFLSLLVVCAFLNIQTIRLAVPSYPCLPYECKDRQMPIAVSILISDDEMAIVYQCGVGGCIAAMMNERSGVPETPSFPAKKYPRVQEDVP